MKQNIFTLEELQQIKREYELDEDGNVLICHSSYLFKTHWFKSATKIKKLGSSFLRKNSQWKFVFSCGERLLFVAQDDLINRYKRRQVRIEFLNWLIENTES